MKSKAIQESSRETEEGKAQKHMVAGPTGEHGNSWRQRALDEESHTRLP